VHIHWFSRAPSAKKTGGKNPFIRRQLLNCAQTLTVNGGDGASASRRSEVRRATNGNRSIVRTRRETFEWSVQCQRRSPHEKRKKKKKCLSFHVAFESFSFPLLACVFFSSSRFIWQTLMPPKSRGLHCSEDLLGESKNIVPYRCRNTAQESEKLQYTWGEVDAAVRVSWEKLSTSSQLGI